MSRLKTALVLIAHGSRRPEANDDVTFIADQVRSRGDFHQVVAAFLELAQPDIPTAAHQCVAAGAHRVVLTPYFLSAGIHVERDLHRIRAELGAAYPSCQVELAPPLGRHPLLVDIVLQRASERASAIRPIPM